MRALIAIACLAVGGCAWLAPRPIVAPDTTTDLHAGHFADARHGIVVTHATGELHLTRDGAASWQRGADLPDHYLEAAWMLDRFRGFVGGERGMYRTADGGLTVNAVSEAEGMNVYAIEFPSPRQGYALGFTAAERAPAVLRTDDGGRSWRRLESLPSRGMIAAAAFDAPAHGLVALGRDLLLTRDNGANWLVVATQFGTVRALHRAPGGRWWAAGHDGLLRSSPDAITWSAHPHPPQRLRDVLFIDRSNGWLAGDAAPGVAPLWRTRDGGRSWQAVEGVTADVHQLVLRGWAVLAIGDGGLLLELRP